MFFYFKKKNGNVVLYTYIGQIFLFSSSEYVYVV